MSDIIEKNQVVQEVICNECIHFFRDKKGSSCTAFEVIPNEILFGKNMHETPLKSQGNKIVFTPIIEENV
jgi:hypothetical protein